MMMQKLARKSAAPYVEGGSQEGNVSHLPPSHNLASQQKRQRSLIQSRRNKVCMKAVFAVITKQILSRPRE